MGTKRVGLARTQTLIENLKRSLNMGGAAFTDVASITTTGNLTVGAALTTTGNVTVGEEGLIVGSSPYTKWATGDWSGLDLVNRDNAAMESGIEIDNQSIVQSEWLGDDDAEAELPAATAGTLAVIRFSAQADGGNTNVLTFNTQGSDKFAIQTLQIYVRDLGNLQLLPRSLACDFVQDQSFGGGALKTSVDGDNQFKIGATGTHNQTNIGAEMAFYCAETGFWLISWRGSELGSGAINTQFDWADI